MTEDELEQAIIDLCAKSELPTKDCWGVLELCTGRYKDMTLDEAIDAEDRES